LEGNQLYDAVEFEVLNWRQVYTLLLRQAKKICDSGFNPEVIVGISRGGWIPARVLSDLLGNPNLANVKVESYKGLVIGNLPVLAQTLSLDVKGKRVLTVDEIADSGNSLRVVVRHVLDKGALEVKTATLFYKKCCLFKPNYFEKCTKSWVVFPWESRETVRSILEVHKADLHRIREELEKLLNAGMPRHLIARFFNEFSEVTKC
jgi:hypoxanthine phosphoribosyltransferase